MPDYDYEQFDRRQEEWEKQKALEAAEETVAETTGETTTTPEPAETPAEEKPVDNEDDMTW